MKEMEAIRLSLVKNYNSIQSKIEKLVETEVLDIKQLSDLERFVNMQDTILDSLLTVRSLSNGELL